MLVICEECAKKYNVDESQIKGTKARFTCQKCGHSIVVRKPDLPAATSVQAENTNIPSIHTPQ